MNQRIDYTKPSISELEIEYVTDAIRNGWGPRCYEYIERFEESFKRHLGVKYAIATSSATGALHMGMAALGIGEGDEVILANSNWVASLAPILHLGATPVFVDINENDWCLNSEEVSQLINSKTKAIMAVHLYGNLCEMEALSNLAQSHGIHLIEDAAEAIGSVYKGQRAGSIGTFGAFSFHGTKTMTTGEGGIFVTNDAELYNNVLTLSNHGRERSQKKQFWADRLGFKYKMSNVQAAIGLGQIERIESLIDRKREIFHYYKASLESENRIKMNPLLEDRESGYWINNIIFDVSLGIERDSICAAFNSANIDARVFFWPLSTLPFVDMEVDTPVAFDLPNRAINLPSFHDISVDEQDRVISVLKKLIG
jgi:perosamine synthetase